MSRMLEEIRQQPEALERTFSGGLRGVEKLRQLMRKRRPRLVVLVARGTSDNAALFGRYLLEITTGIPVSLAAPSIATLYQARVDYRESLVVAISQSGESTDTNLVLERAREQGATTLGITNERSSTLAGLAEHVFLVRAGKEKSVAATKTYTGQMLMLYLLAWALEGGVRMPELERLPETVESALRLEPEVRALSERYRYMRHAVVVGRGLNYANAFELSLKLMETCYVVAERFSSADFLHGPIALVEPSFPVFAFAPAGVTWPSMDETLAKLQGLQAEIVAITDSGNREVDARATRVIRLPRRVKEILTPIPYIVPAQIFAACLAAQKGLDPDQPRTLHKVTLTL
ncbi:Glutamine--fructose-6-phosphate transaminase (Isomerizing) [Candidatus Sulfopaludibacter sp. SbA4]|nr:Glutamine--fructose-6-phosphate transaminase (Isomerizing) [Candidatus Sulfopaludibacter sp. SbA4]